MNFSKQLQGVGIHRFYPALKILHQKTSEFIGVNRINYPIGTERFRTGKLGIRPDIPLLYACCVNSFICSILGESGICSEAYNQEEWKEKKTPLVQILQ